MDVQFRQIIEFHINLYLKTEDCFQKKLLSLLQVLIKITQNKKINDQ